MDPLIKKKKKNENINNLLHASAATPSSWYIQVSCAMHSKNKGKTSQNIYTLSHEIFPTET